MVEVKGVIDIRLGGGGRRFIGRGRGSGWFRGRGGVEEGGANGLFRRELIGRVVAYVRLYGS